MLFLNFGRSTLILSLIHSCRVLLTPLFAAFALTSSIEATANVTSFTKTLLTVLGTEGRLGFLEVGPVDRWADWLD